MSHFSYLKQLVFNAGTQPANTVVLIGRKDNATSLRVKGPQAPSEGVVDVQSYSGIFYNDAYLTLGSLKTRVIHGANIEMDLEIQGPHYVKLTAVDDGYPDGTIFASSKRNFVFNMRADAEVASPKQLIVDRVTTGSTGAGNTSDINLTTNTGSLYINATVTTGALVLPRLTTAQEGALVATNGMVIYNTDMGKFRGYEAGVWTNLT